MSEHCLLFVYGSLRRHALHSMSEWLADAAHWEGEVFVRGDLYRLPSAAMLDELDVYEGIHGRAEDECRRELTVVKTAAGVSVQAWVYWFIQPVEGYAFLPEGDWLNA